MTLYDLFHPLVSHLAACRHDAAAGSPCAHEVLYGHVLREFARIRKTGGADGKLAAGLEDACTYTAFYIDFMVHEGPFPFAGEWRDLGRSEYNELAGDEKFFDYMRRWLEDDSSLAKDHLRLMYAMVASGFSGALERHSVRLEELARRCAERLDVPAGSVAGKELFRQEAPGNASLRPHRPRRAGYAAVAAAAAALVWACSYYVEAYTEGTRNLRSVLAGTRGFIDADTIRAAKNSDTLVVSPVKFGAGKGPGEEASSPFLPDGSSPEMVQPEESGS